jgi:sugar (pentulose or hexulose) kinase
VGKSCAVTYHTYHPQPGWAEQQPQDWYDNLWQAVHGAVDSIPATSADNNDNANADVIRSRVKCISVDTTCCSVAALDASGSPLRPCLLWIDARSHAQTKEIMFKCKGDPALQVNCGGKGPLSNERLLPKALWIRQNEPDMWRNATYICEYQDFINYKLIGAMCASSCNDATRWHWDGEEALQNPTANNPHPGRPLGLYSKLGIPELAIKLPQLCLPMVALVGNGLSKQAAKDLTLPVGLPLAQGGPDAFVGMVGLGCIQPGQLCLITGSSHLHCVVSAKPSTAPGTWGDYRGAPLPGINFAEG